VEAPRGSAVAVVRRWVLLVMAVGSVGRGAGGWLAAEEARAPRASRSWVRWPALTMSVRRASAEVVRLSVRPRWTMASVCADA